MNEFYMLLRKIAINHLCTGDKLLLMILMKTIKGQGKCRSNHTSKVSTNFQQDTRMTTQHAKSHKTNLKTIHSDQQLKLQRFDDPPKKEETQKQRENLT